MSEPKNGRGALAIGGVAAVVTFHDARSSVKDMLASFLKTIAEMIDQALILKAIQAGLGAMGVPGFKDGAGFDKTGPVKPFASGSVVDSPQFFKFASGGSFRSGVMGEAGPNAILPLKRGADVSRTEPTGRGVTLAGDVCKQTMHQGHALARSLLHRRQWLTRRRENRH